MTDRRLREPEDLAALDFDKGDGLVPVVAQDAGTGAVLMVAWATREALARSLATGRMHYWSRSRGALWRKGDTSGHVQHLVRLHADCDGDTVLALVRQEGPACHTGESTCFGEAAAPILPRLDVVLADRARARPAGSYTTRLLEDENLRLKKLGEECAELVTALAKGDRTRAAEEAADLLYHVLAAARASGVGLGEIAAVLEERAG